MCKIVIIFCLFFKQNKIKMAISKYKRAIDLLQFEKSIEDEAKKAKRNQIYHAAHLNISLCLLKNGDSLECIKHCEKVLEENENNVKALFRRGQVSFFCSNVTKNGSRNNNEKFLKFFFFVLISPRMEVEKRTKSKRNEVIFDVLYLRSTESTN